MTAEEAFCDLRDKYGNDFNWNIVSYLNRSFVEELRKEIGSNHFLYNKQIWAVAKCDSNDDVLYLADHVDGTDIYYIFHLTYTKCTADGFPKHVRIEGIEAVKEYIEQLLIAQYL